MTIPNSRSHLQVYDAAYISVSVTLVDKNVGNWLAKVLFFRCQSNLRRTLRPINCSLRKPVLPQKSQAQPGVLICWLV